MGQRTPVSAIMTKNIIALTRSDDLERAEVLFKRHKIKHIPVVSRDMIIGMLSYTDLLRLSFADFTDNSVDDTDALVYNMFTIKQVMKRNIVTVSTSSSIKEVARVLATEEFHALPVVDNNKLVGIVTTTDLIKYLLKQF